MQQQKTSENLLLAVLLASLHSSWCSVLFSQSVYTVTVNETSLPHHPRPGPGFLTLSCTALNTSYTLHTPTSHYLPFEIDSETGELNVTDDIDYDTMEDGFEFFSFNVSCTNPFNNASDIALVQVHVAPVNEYFPEINPSLVLNITETTPSGTLLLSSLPGAQKRLLVHDKDRGVHGQLHFTLLTNITHHFSFDPIHGNITLIKAVDFESEPDMFTYLYHELPVQIRVCDRDTDIDSCPIIHFSLFIIASDDNEPAFLSGSYNATVNESLAIGSSIVTLECSDADLYVGVVRRISLFNPLPEVEQTFSVQSSGSRGRAEVALASNLDFDKQNKTYQFQVICVDILHTATASVTIHVLDVNDNAPEFSNPHHETVIVPDRATPGAIHSVTCLDQDSGENGDIVYEILPQHSLFAMDQNGTILVNIPLVLPDFTLSQSHNVSIQCRDRGSPSLSSTKTLTLIISKTDSFPPQINISHTSISVPENASIGEPLLTLFVYDVDSEAVVITIVSQSLPGTFAISPSAAYNHPNYPALVLNRSLDREDLATHLIDLLATSVSGQQRNTYFSLNISALDVNDNAPKCKEESIINLTTGSEVHSTTVLTLSCSDADTDLNHSLTYSLTSVIPNLTNAQFTIDPTSGDLQLSGAVDSGEYHLIVRVSDMGTPPLTTDVGIQVNIVEVEKGKVSRNEFEIPLIFIIITMVVSVMVCVSTVGGCVLCFCCWYRIRMRRNKDYFVSRSTGMTVIAAPGEARDSIISHRLVPIPEEGSLCENDGVTVSVNQGAESQTSDFPGQRLTELLAEQWPHTFSNLNRGSCTSFTKEELVLEMGQSSDSSSPASSQTPPETRL